MLFKKIFVLAIYFPVCERCDDFSLGRVVINRYFDQFVNVVDIVYATVLRGSSLSLLGDKPDALTPPIHFIAICKFLVLDSASNWVYLSIALNRIFDSLLGARHSIVEPIEIQGVFL